MNDKPKGASFFERAGSYPSWADRNGFADWVLALLWLFLCLTLFQIIAMVIAGGGYLLAEYLLDYQAFVGLMQSLQQGNAEVITGNLNLLFIVNSVWQILFLGLGTYFFVRTCTGRIFRRSYLRLEVNESLLRYIGVSVALIVVVQPFIWFLGWLNSFVPVPEMLKHFQKTQMELIGKFLRNNNSITFALFNVALVPAVCEEILFRGFVLRSFEKKWGIKISIVLSGLLFGLYHIQLSNLLPLAFIGVLLAIVAWKAQSIIPAMALHFVNNAASVIVAVYYPESALAQSSAQAAPPVGLTIASGAISFYLIYLIVNDNLTSKGAPHAQRS